MTEVVNCKNESYDIYIGRPGFWGNPFKIGKDGTRTEVLKKYRKWLLYSDEASDVRDRLPELKNRKLGCWCKPKACHGDIIIEILNNGFLNIIK